MNLITKLQNSFTTFLTNTLQVSLPRAQTCYFELNTDDQKQQFGDLVSNAAMILSKELKRNPREIAQEIAQKFKNPAIEKIEIAGPGFLNFFLTNEAFSKLTQELFEQKNGFFKPEKPHKQKKGSTL